MPDAIPDCRCTPEGDLAASGATRGAPAAEAGFGLVELVMALTLLAIAAAAVTSLLSSAIIAQGLSRQRTAAEQLAASTIETIRDLPYASVGTQSGNPPGTVAPGPQSVTVGGVRGTVTTTIRWVDDRAPTAYQTHADYKRVTVTVTRASDGRQLAQQTTYVGPATTSAYGGTTLTSWTLKLQDLISGGVLPNAGLTLAGGPSAPQQDLTDEAGTVVFPALQPGSYSATVAPPAGYTLFADDATGAATHAALSAGTPWTTVPRAYLPGTLTVTLQNADRSAYTGQAKVNVGYTPPNSSLRQGDVDYAGVPLAIPALNGEPLIPLGSAAAYTVKAYKAGGGFYASAQTNVPATGTGTYPGTRTASVTVQNARLASVTATVKRGSTLCNNATVTISGGPYKDAPWSFTVSGRTTNGTITFASAVPEGSSYKIQASEGGLSTQTSSTTTVAYPATTAATMSFGSFSGSC